MQTLQKASIYIAGALEFLWIVLLLYAGSSGNLTRSLAFFLSLLFLPIVSTAVAVVGFFVHSSKPMLFVMLAAIVEFAMILIVAIVAASLSSLNLT